MSAGRCEMRGLPPKLDFALVAVLGPCPALGVTVVLDWLLSTVREVDRQTEAAATARPAPAAPP